MIHRGSMKHVFWVAVVVALVLAYLAAVLYCGGAR